ncbi:MAG: hypothetical protein A2887_02030 [Alphaproteobacteria bacterium RIFCSPLOWO2_01_FULL_40_26]|nr:MAG: hypothetical protein A3D15_00160 [Alphaproteobacteria bacterium RIFCSPHIGHO2_02_FULL_40_34]OFW87162.1 MAG: hypothetical protein A2794_05440 [Alphaproteobacteria bacterium RIFCSPHIGHO2_01_FULL_40_8]OFW93971.1 MAG: hypothetical protein A2887_02030 [Alphaproteobacteria bacterium RIFCSPLOWO2_01_FULL_40_26]OFX09683.1 MAG: hypothetical protein A3H30_03385 [Alphaproteobacteria bacterium RIFCSPLOWO2_02_FULL_40_19]OFX10832.1 MAG: hypothetical protein A3G22_00450 [Alphaproteobacteria bacterium RI
MLTKIAQNKNISKPVIYGIASTFLTDEEKYFFEKSAPIGFIIFTRNITDKTQLKNLTNSLREVMGGEVLILTDQEGGRVARLESPHWKEYPAGQHFAELYQIDRELAKKSLFENFAAIARDLIEIGINVNCAPVLDILTKQTHEIIGNRAYGNEPNQVSELGKKVCEGLLSEGVYPIIKHIPGHGRGVSDSHLELPIVDASLEELRQTDFVPFQNLNDQKFAMTAHILYSAIDQKNCATISKKVIGLIREEIGFKNILMSDDMSMKALKSGFADKTKSILDAGCDLVLHCNGNMNEMKEIDSVLPNLTDKFFEKLTA